MKCLSPGHLGHRSRNSLWFFALPGPNTQTTCPWHILLIAKCLNLWLPAPLGQDLKRPKLARSARCGTWQTDTKRFEGTAGKTQLYQMIHCIRSFRRFMAEMPMIALATSSDTCSPEPTPSSCQPQSATELASAPPSMFRGHVRTTC